MPEDLSVYKPTYVLHHGLDPSVWQHESGMLLKHPCVGLVQKATIWGKAKEMLSLKKILKNLPGVTFYWAGYGKYVQNILDELEKYPNFKYVGKLSYPDGVRKFLTEIDIYLLLTGLDMAPSSLKEALFMEKPTIATNVGGVPEILDDNKSGFLVRENDSDGIIKKILFFLDNKEDALRIVEATSIRSPKA